MSEINQSLLMIEREGRQNLSRLSRLNNILTIK